MATRTATSSTSDANPKLARRREQASRAGRTEAAAHAQVADVQAQLERNATDARVTEAALTAAKDDVARLKRRLKGIGKDREKLRATRKQTLKRAEKAQEASEAAERKYDKAVLDDLVQREKRQASAAAGAGAGAGAATTPSAETPNDASLPEPERPAATRTAARETAARKTAGRAATPAAARTSTSKATTAKTTPAKTTPAKTTTRKTAARKTAASRTAARKTTSAQDDSAQDDSAQDREQGHQREADSAGVRLSPHTSAEPGTSRAQPFGLSG